MSLDRLRLKSAKARIRQWLMDEVIHAPLEPILHPSPARLRWAGLSILLGHLLFHHVWTVYFPQPYESVPLRMVGAGLGVLFFWPGLYKDIGSRTSAWVFSLVCWITLPAMFFWMYWMNGGNGVWLASVSAMVLIYYHLTDWRLASLGIVVALVVSAWLAWLVAPVETTFARIPPESVWVIGFSLGTALLLGLSSANLRRTRLLNTLSTMGVMAHELRTPLATVHLMGDVLRNLAQHDVPEGKRKKLEELSMRLHNLVRSMNRQIDTQIANAQLQRLPGEKAAIGAGDLVHDVIQQYPYRTTKERDCVQVQVQNDFVFEGSRALLSQVLSNLVKNALHSLASSGRAPQPGDLRLDVGIHRGMGRIAVSDEGVGIPHEKQQRIFEPFYSTQSGVGSGLGLTFCKNVVEAAGGKLSVHSEPGFGAVFMIDVPLDSR